MIWRLQATICKAVRLDKEDWKPWHRGFRSWYGRRWTMIQMVVSQCDTGHIKRRGLIQEAIGLDLKGCRSGYEMLHCSTVQKCSTGQNTRGWKIRHSWQRSHLNQRMQAVIQEAVGCDLRGCRPEYDRLQAWVQKLGERHKWRRSH